MTQIPDRIESRLREIALATSYPPTPDLWPSIRERAPDGSARRPVSQLRWAGVVAAVVLVVGLTLTASPSARAAVYRVFRLGAVRVFLEAETPAAPTRTVDAAPSATPVPVLRPPLDLRGRTSLSAARQAMGDAVRLPTYPADLGEPDLVFLQSAEGQVAVLVWLDPVDPSRAELALYVLGPGAFVGKTHTRLIEETHVAGEPAIWLVGPHFLLLDSGETAFRTLVSGNVLVWQRGETTYRLETDLPLEAAIRVAESLE